MGMKNTPNRVPQRPREKGPLARGRECANRSRSHRSLLPVSLGLPVSGPPSPSWPSPSLGGLYCYIFLSSIHPPPTLVNHPYLSSSARPIWHSFWCSVSCCGPHCPVQESYPHQWGQGVSCVYLIRRWQLFLGCLPTIPLWLAHMAWNLFCDPRVDVLGRRGAFLSHDFGLPRTGSSLAVHSSSLDSLHSSPGASSSSAWALGLRWNGPKPLEPSGPTITPQNHAARLFGRGEGF